VGTVALDSPNIVAGTCHIDRVAVTGVGAGDYVILNVPEALEDGLTATPARANFNEVPIRVCNTTGADLDPVAHVYSYVVIR
jgi:hypothetical protein